MNHIYLLIVSITLAFSASANVVRVNNNKETSISQKIFKTIQAAHDFSDLKAGDTIMIEGSSIHYDDVTLDKRLVLIGPGYFLTENPQTQSTVLETRMQSIYVNPSAAGTIIEGLAFALGRTTYTVLIKADNVIIRRCSLTSAIWFQAQSSGLQVIGNYFYGSAFSLGTSAFTATNIIFKNNIVIRDLYLGYSPSWQNTFTAVENNVLDYNVEVTTATFRNNIITQSVATVKVNSNNIQNNLLAGTQLTGNGNQSYGQAQIFGNPAGRSTDGKYALAAGSPYKQAGYNNAEPGVFGGTTAYVLSGIPPIPTIFEFTADGTATKQAGLPVTIKAKSN